MGWGGGAVKKVCGVPIPIPKKVWEKGTLLFESWETGKLTLLALFLFRLSFTLTS